jgi:hypothetical protein
MAEAFKGCGITINAVLPSILDTATDRADMPQHTSPAGQPA